MMGFIYCAACQRKASNPSQRKASNPRSILIKT